MRICSCGQLDTLSGLNVLVIFMLLLLLLLLLLPHPPFCYSQLKQIYLFTAIPLLPPLIPTGNELEGCRRWILVLKLLMKLGA
ncbi:hypothetical protein QBC44DRAFT_337826 [Cladorrhinum sp. PSN332]|nr:hypothetical protein QBC44DRAFT_337826 [Cladorrhinum sp. PSN332]